MNAQLNQILDKTINGLSAEDRARVLSYARSLGAHKEIGGPGKLLIPFAGAIPLGDLAAMSEAVAAGCEQVNSNEW